MNSRTLGRGAARTAWLCSLALTASAASPALFAQSPQLAVSSIAASSLIPEDMAVFEVALLPVKPNVSAPVVTALAASHDDRFLAAAGDDHIIRLIDARTGKILNTFSGHSDWIQSLVFSADDQQLYSAGNDGRVVRWDYMHPQHPTELIALPYALRSLSISTKRGLLAVGGFGEEVGLWDLNAGKWLFKFSCSCSDQRCVRFSPDGDKLLCGGRDGMLRVWDTSNGQELAHVALHRDRIQTAAFNTEGTIVTSVGDDRRIVRYDLSKEQIVLSRELKGAKLRSLCLINDSLIAAAGADNIIHLLIVDVDEELGTLTGHTGSVAVMCSSGNRLVSGSFDTTVRLWNVKSALGSQREPSSVPVSRVPLDVDKRIEIR